jgi:hypothetical protein
VARLLGQQLEQDILDVAAPLPLPPAAAEGIVAERAAAAEGRAMPAMPRREPHPRLATATEEGKPLALAAEPAPRPVRAVPEARAAPTFALAEWAILHMPALSLLSMLSKHSFLLE